MQASQITLPVVVIDGVAYIVSGGRVLFKCEPSDIRTTTTRDAIPIACDAHDEAARIECDWIELKAQERFDKALASVASELSTTLGNAKQTDWDRVFANLAVSIRHRVKANNRRIEDGPVGEYAGYKNREGATWDTVFLPIQQQLWPSWSRLLPENVWNRKFGDMASNMRKRHNRKVTDEETENGGNIASGPEVDRRETTLQVCFEWMRPDS